MKPSADDHVEQPLAGGRELLECTIELVTLFSAMPVSASERQTPLYQRYAFLRAGDTPYETREAYLDRVYVRKAAEAAILGALASGSLPAWVDAPRQRWTQLIASRYFANNKFDTQTVLSGVYRPVNLNIDLGDDQRKQCANLLIWIKNEDWQLARSRIIADRQNASPGEALSTSTPWEGRQWWSLYEAVAWIGSRDESLVKRQNELDQPGTRPDHFGAVVWSCLGKALDERIAAGSSALTANQARNHLRAACEKGLVQTTGVPAERGDRRVIPAGEFIKAVIWEGKGESLHRSIACKGEAPRWFDLRFCEADVRSLMSGLVAETKVATSSTKSRKTRVSAPVGSPWSEDEMTVAIRHWTQANGSHDRDRAWRDDFRSRQTEHGWGNQNFRDHWAKALNSEGKPGPRPNSAPNSA